MSSSSLQNIPIAIVYDWANVRYGGAEEVLLALKKAFPQAVLYTSVYNKRKSRLAKYFSIKTSFLQKIPLLRFAPQLIFAPFLYFAFESLDLSAYPIVISVTSSAAKDVLTRADQLHFCYLLNPNRYLEKENEQFLEHFFFAHWPVFGPLLRLINQYLRYYDQMANNRPDVIVAISQLVATRFQKSSGRTCQEIIYPPVDLTLAEGFFVNKAKYHQKNLQRKENYYLLVSRLQSYKRIETAIRACCHLERKLIIVGSGPEEKKLRSLAATLEKQKHFSKEELVIFKKNLPSRLLAKTYLAAQAVLIPGEEDFGITALEANLFGKAVLLNKNSGAAELIRDQQEGIHLQVKENAKDEDLVKALEKAILLFEKKHFDPEMLSKNAREYGTTKFVQKIRNSVWHYYQEKGQGLR